MQIIVTLDAVTREEDWSMVRSPSRARRRQRYGHRQNVRVIQKPCAYEFQGKLFMHPAFEAELKRQTIATRDNAMMSALYYGAGVIL